MRPYIYFPNRLLSIPSTYIVLHISHPTTQMRCVLQSNMHLCCRICFRVLYIGHHISQPTSHWDVIDVATLLAIGSCNCRVIDSTTLPSIHLPTIQPTKHDSVLQSNSSLYLCIEKSSATTSPPNLHDVVLDRVSVPSPILDRCQVPILETWNWHEVRTYVLYLLQYAKPVPWKWPPPNMCMLWCNCIHPSTTSHPTSTMWCSDKCEHGIPMHKSCNWHE